MLPASDNHLDFLSIGHLSFDIHRLPGGGRSSPQAGGAAAFTAIMARNFGMRDIGMVSRAGPEYPLQTLGEGIQCRIQQSPRSTVFEDEVIDGHRQQTVVNNAGQISSATVGGDWRRTRLLVAGPLLDELPLDCLDWFKAEFSCVIAQGWFRETGSDGIVRHRTPDVSRIAGPWDVIVLSEQEAAAVQDLRQWRSLCRMLAVTRGERGALVFEGAREVEVPAMPATRVVDPTGAGDIWAAAFSLRYAETGNVTSAGRFAAAAAAVCVSRDGLDGVPRSRDEVEAVIAAAGPHS